MAEWWRGAALYQIYPRSFADTNGDGVGDLAGIEAKLDYVASLGVDGIWLSPFYASPMRDFGYDISDYCAVDPIFGTLADFDRLIARAHDLGLKVIVDQVYCHTADAHAWFAESRQSRVNEKADWYVWADPKPEGSPPNNWQSVFGGPAWRWDARRGQYYLHNFLPEQPQLNVHHPAVQEALLDVARFWLDRGVDGFRLDAINFAMHDPSLRDNPPADNPGRKSRPFDFQQHIYNQSHPAIPAFLERLRGVMDGYPGDRFTVAEVVGDRAIGEMKAFTSAKRLSTAYGFNFLYADAMSVGVFHGALKDWLGDEGWPSWAFSNHDAPRVASRWAAGRSTDDVARFAMALLIALRGNIFIYQGEELGLPQADVPFERLRDPEAIANWPLTLGRDGARTPMPWRGDAPFAGFSTVEPWLPIPEAHIRRAAAAQEGAPDSMLSWTRRLLALRHDEPALRLGALTWRDAPDPLVVFERAYEGRTLLCAFNVGDKPAPFAAEGREILRVGLFERGVLAPLSGVIAEKL